MEICDIKYIWLVVDKILKNMSSSVGIAIPKVWEKTNPCSNPPTSNEFSMDIFDGMCHWATSVSCNPASALT